MYFDREIEHHIIAGSCSLCISGAPRGFYHVNRSERHWMFIEMQEANPKTEKFSVST